MTMGYNDLVMIPPGATNIRIAEVDRAFEIKSCNFHTFQLKVKASNNYLALRNQTGHYYLNGNWRIDYPQQFEAAGMLHSTTYWIHVSKIHSSSDPCLNISCTLDPCLAHRNNVPLRKEVQELEGSRSSHTFCPGEYKSAWANDRGSLHCGLYPASFFVDVISSKTFQTFRCCTKKKIRASSLNIL